MAHGTVRVRTKGDLIEAILNAGIDLEIESATKAGPVIRCYRVRFGGGSFTLEGEGRENHIDPSFDRTNPEHWVCDCPDRLYRKSCCKHALGLGAALKAKGITV